MWPTYRVTPQSYREVDWVQDIYTGNFSYDTYYCLWKFETNMYIVCIYSPWNALLPHLNGEWMVSVHWANSKRTLSKRRAHAEQNLKSAFEWLANAERELHANAIAKWTVNDMWPQDKQFIRRVLGVNYPLTQLVAWRI